MIFVYNTPWYEEQQSQDLSKSDEQQKMGLTEI